MKISGLIIQDRNISVNTEDEFRANYKGKSIYISTNHGFGKARYHHLKRFNIEVADKTGCLDVNTYQDFHEIKDAIRFALIEACLLDLDHNR